MTKRLIAGYCPGTGVLEPFDAIFDDVIDVTEGGMDKVDALILWGGTDISSQYYGEKPHRFHEHPHPPSQRDMLEYRAMKQAKIRGLPIIGVCRGAQFACVFAGGRLIQHVNNHSHNHNVRILETSEIMETSSCHHQMMFPYAMKDSDYEVLAISHKNRSSTHQDQYGKEVPGMLIHDEPEVVYFPQINAIAIQGHPEWMDPESSFVNQCNMWVVEKLMLNTLTEVEGA